MGPGGRGGTKAHGPTVHEVTHDHIVATTANFVVAIFKHETTLGGVRTIQRVYDDHARVFPDGVYMVTIVEHKAPMPESEVRDALARFLASGAGRTRMSAVIHEGSGFYAASVRAVVTGLAMVARLPYPHKVFASVKDSARWFGTSPNHDVDAHALTKTLSDIREMGETQHAASRKAANPGQPL